MTPFGKVTNSIKTIPKEINKMLENPKNYPKIPLNALPPRVKNCVNHGKLISQFLKCVPLGKILSKYKRKSLSDSEIPLQCQHDLVSIRKIMEYIDKIDQKDFKFSCSSSSSSSLPGEET